MYRRYEDPYVLERKLEQAEIALDEARARGDDEDIICISVEINDLQQRLSAAWEDYEAEVYGYE